MRQKLYYIFIFLCFSFLTLKGQDKLVVKADESYESYSFSLAIDIYKKVLDKGFVSPDLLKKLGNAYYFNADYAEAADAYKKLIEGYKEEVGSDYYFRYAQTLKSLENYAEAEEIMKQFIVLTSNDVRATMFTSEKDYLEEIKSNSGKFTIIPFPYNSKYSDFAPAYYKKGLLFSSDRDTGNLARYRHSWNAKDFLDLYKVDADEESQAAVLKLKDNINTRLHESTSVVTADGETIYFTRNNTKDGKYVKDEDGVIRLKIFKSTLVNGEWSISTELPFNSDSYSVAHPSLSADDKTMYFASDMPGTLGQSDIFKVAINPDGSFGIPVNLGPVINTESRETFPFITDNNALYFASDGHPGLGGLDLFAVSVEKGAKNGAVVNLGTPINSQFDDFSLIINPKLKTGYFASNRTKGLGSDDIYRFEQIEEVALICNQKISGRVLDKATNAPLIGAMVKVIDEDNNEIASAVTSLDGSYMIAIDCNQGNFVRTLLEGYIPSEEYLNASEGAPVEINFFMEKELITAGFGDDLAKLLQLSTIYFDLNKYDIRTDAEVEIQKVIAAMEKFPSLVIKVNSHTDSQGFDDYNLTLSKNRAKATVQYMIGKGIAKERLLQEGFGETKILNECVNGVQCSEEKHQLNRRSEFIIIE